MGKLLSTTEVATRLGITVPRIQSFIWEGRLPAIKVGRSYAIDEDDLKLIQNRKTGRPPNVPKSIGKRPVTIELQTKTTLKLDKSVKRAADEQMVNKKKGGRK